MHPNKNFKKKCGWTIIITRPSIHPPTQLSLPLLSLLLHSITFHCLDLPRNRSSHSQAELGSEWQEEKLHNEAGGLKINCLIKRHNPRGSFNSSELMTSCVWTTVAVTPMSTLRPSNPLFPKSTFLPCTLKQKSVYLPMALQGPFLLL
jgi:hypothetical protein